MPADRIEPAVPDDAPAVADVHVTTWRSTYRGLLPDAFLAGLAVEPRAAYWRREIENVTRDPARGCVLVARNDAGRLVGFASGGPEREEDAPFDAELYTVYLLDEHRGRGLGRALVRRVARHLREHGHGSLRVWVLRGNPAQGFYERLGGEAAGEKPIRIGDEAYVEVAYGWPDLRAF